MMSQIRQNEKDSAKAQSDYQTKIELIEINKLDKILQL